MATFLTRIFRGIICDIIFRRLDYRCHLSGRLHGRRHLDEALREECRGLCRRRPLSPASRLRLVHSWPRDLALHKLIHMSLTTQRRMSDERDFCLVGQQRVRGLLDGNDFWIDSLGCCVVDIRRLTRRLRDSPNDKSPYHGNEIRRSRGTTVEFLIMPYCL